MEHLEIGYFDLMDQTVVLKWTNPPIETFERVIGLCALRRSRRAALMKERKCMQANSLSKSSANIITH